MKTKSILVYILLLSYTLIFCECKRKNLYVSQETKNLAYYKEGSWWVYRVNETASRDCVYVCNSGNSSIFGANRDANMINVEQLSYELIHSYSNCKDYVFIEKYYNEPSTDFEGVSILQSTNFGELLFRIYINNSASPSQFVKTVIIADTSLSNINYNNVYKITCTGNNVIIQYLIAEKHWVLKKTENWINNDSTIVFDLLKSNIVQ